MTARCILIEAMRRGIRLEPEGENQLAFYYDGEVDADFQLILRYHKPVLLKLLRTKRHTARQALAGEFDGADAGTWHGVMESLLENAYDPQCSRAVDHLKKSIGRIHDEHFDDHQ